MTAEEILTEKWDELLKDKLGTMQLHDVCIAAMEAYAAQQVAEAIKLRDELIEALNEQVELVCSDAFTDTEGYAYKALASSQKITKLEAAIKSTER